MKKNKKKMVIVLLSNVDWKLLRKQKQYLVKINDDEYIEGLINFIDDIQDKAVEWIGETAVFGKTK